MSGEKEFYYHVNGSEFHDTEPWGVAWRSAVEMAKLEHSYIERTVVCGDSITYEFYAKGGCFLNDRFWEKDKVAIF